jgi:hypothetical protein
MTNLLEKICEKLEAIKLFIWDFPYHNLFYYYLFTSIKTTVARSKLLQLLTMGMVNMDTSGHKILLQIEHKKLGKIKYFF